MDNTLIAALIQEIAPIAVSIIVAWLAWLARKYLRSLGDEKKLATITKVANAAIDYAEDLDKRGDLEKILARLNLSPEVMNHTSRGIQKLNIAGQWVEDELKRMGIEMSEEEAQKWVAAEFQKRVAGLELTPEQLAKIESLLTLVQKLDKDKVRALLAAESKGLSADDAPMVSEVDQPSPKADPTVEPSPPEPPHPPPTASEPEAAVNDEPDSPPEDELSDLARQAVDYVETLKIDRQLTVPEIDIATAWMLTEVTKRGLTAQPEEIAREIHAALEERQEI